MASIRGTCQLEWMTDRMRQLSRIARPLAALGLIACRGGANYESPLGPRYASAAPSCARARSDAELLVVTYNVEFARRIDEAIRVLRDTPELADADVVLLQEMTAEATSRIAGALGMGWVYYPAIYHRRAKQDFGNAVLSRWPIEDDGKLVLPHRSRYAGTQRAATVATVRIGTIPVRVYSTHLGTIADVSGTRRRQQLDHVFRDAIGVPNVIVGGDMNTSNLEPVVRDHGFQWPTRSTPKTTRFGRLDHILVRGEALNHPARAGIVAGGRSASDHSAVWASLPLSERPDAAIASPCLAAPRE
jgi:endonuclease/exonuclease/phosphatase family metal-dependent hydrolase